MYPGGLPLPSAVSLRLTGGPSSLKLARASLAKELVNASPVRQSLTALEGGRAASLR